MAEVTAIV